MPPSKRGIGHPSMKPRRPFRTHWGISRVLVFPDVGYRANIMMRTLPSRVFMQDKALGSEWGVRLARCAFEIVPFDEFGKSTFVSCEDEKKRKTCVGRLSHAPQWYVRRKTIDGLAKTYLDRLLAALQSLESFKANL